MQESCHSHTPCLVFMAEVFQSPLKLYIGSFLRVLLECPVCSLEVNLILQPFIILKGLQNFVERWLLLANEYLHRELNDKMNRCT